MKRPPIIACCLCFGFGLAVGLLKSQADIEALRGERQELHEHLRQRDREIELRTEMIADLVKQHMNAVESAR